MILDTGSYAARGGGLVVGSRAFLVGILAAVHVHKATGEIVALGTGQQVQVNEMMDLGIVYKTTTIIETIDALLASRHQHRSPPSLEPPAVAEPVEPPDASLPESDQATKPQP